MAKVLFLYNIDADRVAASYRQNVEAFGQYSRHDVYPFDTHHPGLKDIDLARFDAVLIHWSLVLSPDFRSSYFGAGNFERLVDFAGAKFVMLQDEYRWISHSIDGIAALGAKVHFTSLCEQDASKVYDDPRMAGTELVGVFTGYLDPALPGRKVASYEQRPIDIGYRGRDLTGEHSWLGELAQEKTWICERFLADERARALHLDVSNRREDRLLGEDWFRFIDNCKAMLGTESGASVCDFDDSIRKSVLAYVRLHPEAGFSEIRDACFPGKDWQIPARGLSPRVLEAAALRTLMINYEGLYHGVLEPWTHYVPLKKDHSNFEEVVAFINDHGRATGMIRRAYEDVGANPAYQYPAFVEVIDRKIEEHTAGRTLVRHGYDPTAFDVITHLKADERGLYDEIRRAIADHIDVGNILRPLDALNDRVENIRRTSGRANERSAEAAKESHRLARENKQLRRLVERSLRLQRLLLIVALMVLLLLVFMVWRAVFPHSLPGA